MSRQDQQNTRFLDKSFNEQSTRSYVMSLLFDTHSCTICIYHPVKNKVIGLLTHYFGKLEANEGLNQQLAKLLDSIAWLGSSFSRVNFIYRNALSTLVPLPLFNVNNAALYLEFNHIHQQENRVVFDNIRHTDAVNVYSLPELIIEKAKTTWPNVSLKHSASCLIENLHVLAKNKNSNNTVFLNVAIHSFDLVYFKNSKLHFYNQFAFNTKEDFIYFLLTTLEQLKLNPESVKLLLSGNIDQSDAVYEIIYRYIRQVSFIGRNENLSYSYVFDEMKPHKHFVLFNSLQCE